MFFLTPPTFKGALPKNFKRRVDERFKQRFGVWLVKDNDVVTGCIGIYALRQLHSSGLHPTGWMATEIQCPCHGSGIQKRNLI